MTKRMHIIGFGAVGQAFHRMLQRVIAAGGLDKYGISSINYYAPEIKEVRKDGIFTFNPAPAVERDTLMKVLDLIAPSPGDILCELATRIDTITIWVRGIAYMALI
jgi:hypothetical protein